MRKRSHPPREAQPPGPATSPTASSKNDSVILSVLRPGERGIVLELAGGRGLLCRMASMGFTPGAEVTVLQNFGHGPLIAQVRGARIALGRGEAGRIRVRRRAP